MSPLEKHKTIEELPQNLSYANTSISIIIHNKKKSMETLAKIAIITAWKKLTQKFPSALAGIFF